MMKDDSEFPAGEASSLKDDKPIQPIQEQLPKKKKKKKKNRKPNQLNGHQPSDDRVLENPLCDQLEFLQQVCNSRANENSDSSEDEGIPDYKIGGEILVERYLIIQKLGWGHFSTVWLAKDKQCDTYVALKVQKSAPHYLEAAFDEVEILDQVANAYKTEEWIKSINKYYQDVSIANQDPENLKFLSSEDCYNVQILNAFLYYGPNGKHFVMVFEIQGVNLLEIIKRYNYKGVPIKLVKRMAKQLLIGLDYIHRMCNIIHTDLKPENIIMCLTDDELLEIWNDGILTKNNPELIKGKLRQLRHKIDQNQNLTKNQRKKLKKKQKKQQDNVTSPNPSRVERGRHHEEREGKPQPQPQPQAQTQPKPQQEEEEKQWASQSIVREGRLQKALAELKKPRAKSLPKKIWSNREDLDGEYIFDITAYEEFKGELDEYLAMKQKIRFEQKLIDQQDEPIPNLQQHISVQENDHDKGAKRGPKLEDKFRLKICDLGNGCWTHHHFSSEIQTRQYRSPETIIGVRYSTSADIWSFACTIFEMITGDFLFEPRKGQYYDKDDDHLAQMMELLGRMPKNLAFSGKNSKAFFDRSGHLKKIRGLNFWPLKKVLMEKYRIKEKEAQGLSDFLIPMLSWYPTERATAQDMLSHYWLTSDSEEDVKMNEAEYKEYMMQQKIQQEFGEEEETGEMSRLEESDVEMNNADLEEIDSDEESDWANDENETVVHRDIAQGKNLNNSFSGPYPDNWDHLHVDRGPNPQFLGI